MRFYAMAVAALVAVGTVPATHGEDPWAPELAARFVEEGVKLEWTTPSGPPGPSIDEVEIWRYDARLATVEFGAQAAGFWELYDVKSGVAAYYVDKAPEADGDTFYFVRLVFDDGSVSSPSNPSAVNYPHCSWIMLSIPPVLASECLFPPPFVGTLEA